MCRARVRQPGCRSFLWCLVIFVAANCATSFAVRREYALATDPLHARKQRSSTFPERCTSHPNLLNTCLELSGGSDPEEVSLKSLQRGKIKGRALLVFVAFLYGTLYVCHRRVYALSSPPTAAALSATRGWLAALCFLHVPFHARPSDARTSSSTTKRKPSTCLLWLTAFDLAIWNFVAQGLTNLGLLYCPSARASFLIQSSVIFTPLLSLGAGQKISRSLWAGVGLAFAGLSVLSHTGGEMAAGSTSSLFGIVENWFTTMHPGDVLILGGAFCWSVYLLRLSLAANNKRQIEFPAVSLQAIKTLLLAIMYTCWWILNSCLRKTATATSSSPWWSSRVAWFWLALSAIGPGAIADVLQQKGQQHVSATEANIIMSSEPVFTAMSGFLLLGEKLATREVMGGAIILLAALVSSLSS